MYKHAGRTTQIQVLIPEFVVGVESVTTGLESVDTETQKKSFENFRIVFI